MRLTPYVLFLFLSKPLPPPNRQGFAWCPVVYGCAACVCGLCATMAAIVLFCAVVVLTRGKRYFDFYAAHFIFYHEI